MGVPPIEAFDLQKAISKAVDKSVKGMEKKLLQTIGHPTTYEDLLNEVNQSLFKQTIVDVAHPVKFNTPTFPNKAITEILNCHNTITLFALKKGLLLGSNFLNEICSRHDRGRTEAHSREDRSNQQGKGRRLLSPPKYTLDISAKQLVMHLRGKDFVQWPGKITSPPKRRNLDLYCEFHCDHEHLTVDCKALHYEVTELLKKGHLKEFLSEKGRKMYGLDKNDSRRDKHGPNRMLSPPPIKKIIGAIFGGSILSGETCTSIKKHTRKVNNLLGDGLPFASQYYSRPTMDPFYQSSPINRPSDDSFSN
ncbi:hypothetical protein TIFTF001_017016 [Ficus carica]|uniref:Uncharacterized protein n=1 Tax=Ficus carica TaxID=3494 RepID=A0AA88A1D9_FICCA|nr:hypothetical protein TIFTF001_017016 [Ficus carica]